MSEYQKTSTVEEVEEKLENAGFFCDLKLLLFLLRSGNPGGFQAFKDFLSPLFQEELIAMKTGTKWNAENLHRRMRKIRLENQDGESIFQIER